MAFLPLHPGIRVAAKGSATAGKASPAKQKSLVEQTLKRDQRTCRFCGFHSEKYQRTIPYDEAGTPPFATICTFCEQCVVLDRAGITGSGLLLWLPEIGQAELNHITRAIYIARALKGKPEANDKNTAAAITLANRAFDALAARRGEAKKRLGSDDPMMLATVLHESLDAAEREAVAAKIDGIRVMPSEKHMIRGPRGDVNHLPQMVAYWCSKQGPYGNKPLESWADLFAQASAKVGHA